jgi:hypothetical protein
MSTRTQRKRFAALAGQLRDGVPLTSEQTVFFIEAFEKIGVGFSADEVLGLKHTAGYTDTKEIAAENNRKILHWMACAMQPIHDDGLGLSLDQTIEAVIALSVGEWTNPITNKTYAYKDKDGNKVGQFQTHTYETLKKMWSEAGKSSYRSTEVSALDENSPYAYKK